MSTPALTLYIRLEGESEERPVKVFPGQLLIIGLGGTGNKVMLNLQRISGNIFVQHRKELAGKDETIAGKDRELAKKDELIESLMPYKEFVMAAERLKPEAIRQQLAPQQQSETDSRTVLEQRCFASQCRLPLIKHKLSSYIASRGNKWKEGYWAIVHQIFRDLRWWTGKDTEFIDWVNKSGHKLKEDNFKKVKRTKRDLLEQWYTITGPDPYAETARELYDIFAGGPQLPNAATYEDGYISHTVFIGNIQKTGSAPTSRHRNIYIHIVDSPGHDERRGAWGYATITKRTAKLMTHAAALGILPQSHKPVGILRQFDVTKPGRRRRLPASAALLGRKEIGRI